MGITIPLLTLIALIAVVVGAFFWFFMVGSLYVENRIKRFLPDKFAILIFGSTYQESKIILEKKFLHPERPDNMNTFENWRRNFQEDNDAMHRLMQRKLREYDEKEIRSAICEYTIPESHQQGPLYGIPFLVKDLFDVKGYQTLASSIILKHESEKKEQSSPLVELFEAKGAGVYGKTNLVEFAYGLTGTNPHTGDCFHPHLKDRLTGGSSSGSAWSVAAGIVPIALGTDTGGSIRIPAAFCGLYGLRCEPNEWSTTRCFPLAKSFDSAGWFTTNAKDMIETIEIMFGVKSTDKELRILDLSSVYEDKVESAVFKKLQQYISKLNPSKDEGIASKWKQEMEKAVFCYNVLTTLEAYDVHQDWVEKFADEYDPNVLPLILRAKKWTQEEIEEAQNVREKEKKLFAEIFKQFDVVLLPASPTIAPKKSELTKELRLNILELNTPASNAQYPALTIPFSVPKVKGATSGIQAILPKQNYPDIAIKLLSMISEE